MGMYWTCQFCGDHLNHGEHCKCQEQDGDSSEQCDLNRNGTGKGYGSGRRAGVSVCAGKMPTRYAAGSAGI